MATQSNSNWSRTSPGWNTWLDYIRAHWRYRAEGKRDVRLDLLRGLCVCIMIIDHIGGLSPLRTLTGNNTFFVSAAEGFVFISGLLLGEVYRKLVERDGFRAAVVKALQRAWTLYVLTFVLTIGLAYVSWSTGSPWVGQEEIVSPLRFTLRVLTLRRSYPFTDILVMYTLLLVGAPLALWFLHRGWTWALLAGSWSLWLLYQISPQNASQPLPTIQSFHPAAWQIFFVHAMAIGFHRRQLAPWLRSLRKGGLLTSLALLFAILVAIHLTGGLLLEPFVPGDAQTFLGTAFNKNDVRFGRILAALIVFPLAFAITTYVWQPLRTLLGWLVLPLGQSSLYSYTMHLPLIIIFAYIFQWPPGNTWMEQTLNALLQLAAVATIWLMIRHRFLFRIVPQ